MNRWVRRWQFGFGGERRMTVRAVHLKETGDQALKQNDHDTAQALYEESLSLFQRLEHWRGVLWVRLGLGYLAHRTQNYQAARSHFEQCVSLGRNLHSKEHLAVALTALAHVTARQGDYELTDRLCREALELWRSLEHSEGIANIYCLLGWIAQDYEETRRYHHQALVLCREQDRQKELTAILCSLGHLASPNRDNAQERAYLEECLQRCQLADDKRTRSYALNNLGNIEQYAGDLDLAEELYRESLHLKQEIGDEWALAYTLEGCAAIAIARRQGERAARLLGAAAGIRQRLGTPLEPVKRIEYEENLAVARTLLDPELFERAWSEGRSLSLSQVVAYACSE